MASGSESFILAAYRPSHEVILQLREVLGTELIVPDPMNLDSCKAACVGGYATIIVCDNFPIRAFLTYLGELDAKCVFYEDILSR